MWRGEREKREADQMKSPEHNHIGLFCLDRQQNSEPPHNQLPAAIQSSDLSASLTASFAVSADGKRTDMSTPYYSSVENQTRPVPSQTLPITGSSG